MRRRTASTIRVRAVAGATPSPPSNVVTGSRIKDITFEDGTASLVDGTSGASLNLGGGMTQELTTPLKGQYSARASNVSGTYLEQTLAPQGDLSASFYVSVRALPSADAQVAAILAGATTVARVVLRPIGTLCLEVAGAWSGGSLATACTTTALALAPATFRVGLHQRAGDGTRTAVVEAFLASGDAQFTTDATGRPLAFASTTIAVGAAGYWQTGATAIRIGPATTGKLDATFDDAKLDAAFMPRASRTPAPTDATPPTVALTAPADASTVNGVVGLAANASDDTAVTKVEFFAGATLVGTATASPYGVSWTTAIPNSAYVLTARAWDAAGNNTVSAPRTVTLSNPPPVTTISCGGAACAAWYRAAVAVSFTATDAGGPGLASTRYTTNGTDPTLTNGTVYTGGSVSVAQTATVAFRSWDAAGNTETVKTQAVRIDAAAPTVAIRPPRATRPSRGRSRSSPPRPTPADRACSPSRSTSTAPFRDGRGCPVHLVVEHEEGHPRLAHAHRRRDRRRRRSDDLHGRRRQGRPSPAQP